MLLKSNFILGESAVDPGGVITMWQLLGLTNEAELQYEVPGSDFFLDYLRLGPKAN